jgi:hypothetical protein
MKKILFLLAVVLAALPMSAADVSSSQAQAAANAFLKKQVAAGRLKASAVSGLQLAKAETSVAKPSAVDYYIFNSAKSYVVVAGDDLAPEILMYGEEGALDINNIPPAMQWLLNKYKYQIDGLKAGTMVPVKIPKFATTPVAPLVTANWDQSSPYNNQCPSNSVTGCPATSLSMCYYKWKWPETYPACAAISGTGGASAAALPERAADWANIIDEYTGPTNTSYSTAQANAVAWLMRYAGQSIPDYYYSSSASGANDPEIYQGVLNMGYTDAQYLLLTELQQSGWSYSNGPQQYTDAQWNEFMLNELHNGRPIEYLAYDCSSYQPAGHAFNVFGVNANGQYYVNWGWSGDSNGYCTLHNFTTSTGATGQAGSYVFNYGEAMIIGIEPPAGALTDPRITVNPATLTMNTTVGTPVTATFTVTGANLTSNVNLALSGDYVFSLSTTSISATQAENGVTVTVTYDPAAVGTHEATITLTSDGAENVTVKLNGTAEAAPLETYAPVMLDATNITMTSFTATWTDQTPAENVESYTLYVQDESHPIQPEAALLDTTDWTAAATVPTGWTQYNLKYYSTTNSCYLSTNGYVQSCNYDLTGYDKVTVMVYSQPYEGDNTITVATSVDSKTQTVPSGSSFKWYTFVLNCSTNDYVKLTSSGMPDLRYMKVYAGDLTAVQLKATETGDATYRVITGITGKSYTVTGLTEGGTFNFYVVANYVNDAIAKSNVKEVTLLENTNPVISVNPTAVEMTANTGETATATINVSGANLTGNVTLALTDENGVYSITPTTISAADAMNGKDVTVTYAPTAFGTQNATITLSSADAENVTVALNGTATLAKAVPVMQPADEQYINLTKFRADWSDQTPAGNVSSYTLEVNAKVEEPEPEPELIASIDGTTYTNQNYQAVNLTAPWSGNNVYGGYGAIYFRNATHQSATTDGYIKYTIPAGYENKTFTLKLTTASGQYGSGRFVVGSTQTAAVEYNMSEASTHSWVVTGSTGDVITITSPEDQYSPDIAQIEVYSGDATAVTFNATETGGADYRLIEGITDKFYTVENLTAGGTFLYKVKAIYLDGTESDWSNIEEVTLFENGHGYQLGDVNHKDGVTIADVSALIDYLLDSSNPCCTICADVNGKDGVTIADVSALIDYLLEN